MKNNIHIQQAAILSLLAVGLGTTAVHAQTPKQGQSEDIEKTDPFKKGATAVEAKAPGDQSAETLDAQARILFARGETDKAIATQEQAVEKAKNDVEKYTETLNRYNGNTDESVRYIQEKLRRIIIPRIEFEDVSLEEAINFLRLRSAELDTLELDPAKKGVNFVIRIPRVGGLNEPFAPQAADTLPRIAELRLRNVPLSVALKYIADSTNHRIKIDAFAVSLVPIAP